MVHENVNSYINHSGEDRVTAQKEIGQQNSLTKTQTIKHHEKKTSHLARFMAVNTTENHVLGREEKHKK